jgi:vacuolar-type H+-ATPase subunit I/STV1
MAVARLSRATLKSPRRELGVMLLKLVEFGEFHIIRGKECIQDIDVLVLCSRAQAAYSKSTELLDTRALKLVPAWRSITEFKAHDIGDLLHTLEEELETLSEVIELDPKGLEAQRIKDLLSSIREASLTCFNGLQKVLLKTEPDGDLSLQGFIPSRAGDEFRQALDGYVVSVCELTKKESQDPSIPSLVSNRGAISIFEDLALQRGTPKYNEIDPTPLVAFVFPLFFGIMFGDVGHGITLLVIGWYLYSRTKYTYWGKLLAVLGSSALVIGLIRGSFFGIAFESPIRGIVSLPPALDAGSTLQYIPFILEVAIVIGTFHLATAYAISFINDFRSSNYLEAFLNRLATLVLYGSIIPFGLAVAGTGLQFGVLYTSTSPTPFFNDLLGVQIPVSVLARDSLPFILASLTSLSISHPILEYGTSHSIRKAARAIPAGLMEIVLKPFEFFTNVLSYVRLGVLLITTTVLGSLVASVLVYGVLGGIFALVLNVMVMAMEGLIVYIQDMRLQLYEWLSKFYVGTGVPFAPLAPKSKLFKITFLEPAMAMATNST